MATPLQIQANRLNALKSTGPRTPEGKAASRLNALKTGIDARLHVIPGEDPEELESLTAGYHARFQPEAPDERYLVDSLVAAEWQLRRLRAIEAQLWKIRSAEAGAMENADESSALASAFTIFERDFTRLHRRIDSAERSYHRALKELRRIRAEREQPAGPPDPVLAATRPLPPSAREAEPASLQSVRPQIGFVPSAPEGRLPAAAKANPGAPVLPSRLTRCFAPVCAA